MKVILSRKGFDSSNGGILSPIIDNRIMLSLPIPSKDKDPDPKKYKDSIKYEELTCNGDRLDKILTDLGYDLKQKPTSEYCHLDPDLDPKRRKEQPANWRPAFGQRRQAAKYLDECNVDEGDLFLFFGGFRHVIKDENGIYQYAKKGNNVNDVYYGEPIHAIWGYMQVDKVVRDPKDIEKFDWHPHAKRIGEPHNTIYLAKEKLSFAPDMPGCGIFDYDPKRVLTIPGRTKAIWKKEAALLNTGRKNCDISSKKTPTGIYYAGIWQEMLLDNNNITQNWAESLF